MRRAMLAGWVLVAGCGLSEVAIAPGTAEDASSTALSKHLTPPPTTGALQKPLASLSADWVTQALPFTASQMLLLTDGRLMVQSENAAAWSILTPDGSGSYLNGTWSAAAPMSKGRLYFASAVLEDGRVVVMGGEYTGSSNATEDPTAELYNPVTNAWSPIAGPGWPQLGDAASTVLPDGRVLVGSLSDTKTVIWDPTTQAWSNAGTKGTASDEETWVLLPTGQVLTIDCSQTRKSELWAPGKGWVPAGALPVDIVETSSQELGPAFLLGDGRVLYVGATGHTAVYTPGVSGAVGTWAQGVDLPVEAGAQVIAKDSPGVLLQNGHVLITGSTAGSSGWGGPTHFFDLDPTTSPMKVVTVAPPPNNTQAPYEGRLMLLPTGEVAYTQGSGQISFRTVVAPVALPRPAITSAPSAAQAGATFLISGTLFNGVSQTVMYGDDAQQATNYPLVRLTGGNGSVVYARTFNHSTMGVNTGTAIVSTNVTLPSGMANGAYAMVVIANGIASAPVAISVSGGVDGGGSYDDGGYGGGGGSYSDGGSYDDGGYGGGGGYSYDAGAGGGYGGGGGGYSYDAGAGGGSGGGGGSSYDAGAGGGSGGGGGTSSDGGYGGGSGGETVLTPGVPRTNLSGATGSQTFFRLDVPANVSNLTFVLDGGSGDADLYLKLGAQPSLTAFDCRPYLTGNNETCTVAAPAAGTYYVMLNGYAAYAGASLVASFSSASSDPVLTLGQTLTQVSGAAKSLHYFKIVVPAGTSTMTVAIAGGTGDADLYLKAGAHPTATTYDCRPYKTGNAESCTVTAPSGTYYVMLSGYSAFAGVSLSAK